MIAPTWKVTKQGDEQMLTISLPIKAAIKERRESDSGKSLLLTTLSERVEVDGIGMVRVNLNVFQKNPAYTLKTA